MGFSDYIMKVYACKCDILTHSSGFNGIFQFCSMELNDYITNLHINMNRP